MSRSQPLRPNNITHITKLCYVTGTADAVNQLVLPLRFGQLQLPGETTPLSLRVKPFVPTSPFAAERGVLVITYNTSKDSSFSEMFSGAYDYQLSGLSLIVVGFVNTEDPTRGEKANIEDGQKFAEELGADFFKVKNGGLPLLADSEMARLYRLIAERAQPTPSVRFLDPAIINHSPESSYETNLSLQPR